MGTGPRVDCKKPGQSGRLTEMLARTSSTGILEEVDYDAVKVVLLSSVLSLISVALLIYS